MPKMAYGKTKRTKKGKKQKRPIGERQHTVYRPVYAVDIYACLRDGMRIVATAEALGTTYTTLLKWKEKYPEVRHAVEKGKEAGERNKTEDLREFIAGRLPDHLREVYEELEKVDDPDPSTNIEQIVRDGGKRMRQQLFLHALFCNNFNPSAARRMVSVTKKEFDSWRDNDLDFMELVEEVMTAKKDFVEGKLMELVRMNDVSAVIFANKTLNRDRGYDPRLTVEHKGTVSHVHASLEKVFDRLSVDTQREVVAALEAYREDVRTATPRVVKVIEEEMK